MIKVSVIIPTYNYAKFISETIRSVLDQTFSDYEVIIVDDGSTDETKAVIKPYLKDARVKYVYQENKGLSSARNLGIRTSHGGYIALLDSDDLWMPEKLQKQVPLLESDHNVALVYCMAEHINQAGEAMPHSSWPHPENKSYEDLLYCNWVVGSGSSVLIRKSVFSEVGFFDETLTALEDLNMWIRILRHYRSAYVNEVLVKIRRHSESMQSDIKKMEQNLLQHVQRSIEMFPELKKSEEQAIFHIYEGLMFLSYTYGKKKEIVKYYFKAGHYRPSFYYESIVRFMGQKIRHSMGKLSKGRSRSHK
jgi:glycosyltransferase involved in cell wall biosynthesis